MPDPEPAPGRRVPGRWRSPGRGRGRGGTLLCWLLAGPGLGWAAVRAFGLERGPLAHTHVVQMLAFTPYVAAWSVLPLVLSVLLRRWGAGAVALVAVATLALSVVPRWAAVGGAAAGAPGSEAQATVPIRVLTSNMMLGQAHPADVVAAVRERAVDVLLLQEYTADAEAGLAAAGLDALLPYHVSHTEPGAAGSALYSRLPLSGAGLRLSEASGFAQAYATLTVPGAAPVLVESVHSCAPDRVAALGCWWTDLARQQRATPGGRLRVLAGDFNATLDHVALRRLVGSGYRDAAASVGAGLVGTWGPYLGSPVPAVTIDHVLADRRIGVRSVGARRMPGSDHRALFAVLLLPAA